MTQLPWDPDEHTAKVKFMLAVGRASFDTPSEMTMALVKTIASVMISTAKTDTNEEDFRSMVAEVSNLLLEYVLSGIPIRDAHLKADHAQEN